MGLLGGVSHRLRQPDEPVRSNPGDCQPAQSHLSPGFFPLVTIPIPDESLEAAASVAPEGYFSTVTEDGINYKSLDVTVPSITGRIVAIETYLGKFEDGNLSKIPLGPKPFPEGYQVRMKLAMRDPEKVSLLSLSPTSASAAGSFFRHLKNKGLRPENILVRIDTVALTSKQGGRYGVAVFSLVEKIDSPSSTQEPAIVQAIVETGSPAPSAKPATLKNHWAPP
jgi:hypothetical protein